MKFIGQVFTKFTNVRAAPAPKADQSFTIN
jgi:hypothetical protein